MINKKKIPAVEGGAPVRDTFLPFFRPSISEEDIESVAAALRSGWLTLGPATDTFEKELAKYLGVKNVVAVGSCSQAMFYALTSLGVGPGDEVVTSPLTFASTVQAILHTGATPVLADIEMETFGICPSEVEKRTTGRTKAYLPVHFGGQACRIDDILRLAKEKDIHVVEDAAHSFGASLNGKTVGTFGDVTAFSFYATKNITTGEGGCVALADEELAAKIRQLSYHGMSHDSWARYSEKGSWYYEVGSIGYKGNMSDILSSLGISQLSRADGFLARRQDIAHIFNQHLAGTPFFEVPVVRQGNVHTYHLFVILLRLDHLTIDRDAFVRAMTAENIGCSVHFIPLHRHPFYQTHVAQGETYPVCEDYFSRCISLPMFPDMTDEDVWDVVSAMNRIAAYYSKT